MTDTPFKDFVSAEQVDEKSELALIHRAEDLQAGTTVLFPEHIYAEYLFFENSTRTHTSFEMAERQSGSTDFPFDPAHSTVYKGETLEDTIKTIGDIGVHIAVMRHDKDGVYKEHLGAWHNTAIVNAGDGAGTHPSTMMLDLMTILEEFGLFEGLNIGIVGDLSHSRVARSDMQMLQQLGESLHFAGPTQWYELCFDRYGDYYCVPELVKTVDVLMLLRVLLERLQLDNREAF